MVTQEEILKSIEDVVDPETQITISEMQLVDEVRVSDDGSVKIKMHMTTPLCPAQYAYSIALDVKDRVSALKDVKKVTVVITNHYLSPEINQAVNGPDWKPESPDEAGPYLDQGNGSDQRRKASGFSARAMTPYGRLLKTFSPFERSDRRTILLLDKEEEQRG
ncbi:MAG: metal-sulfur cluster assembly factor [Thermoprotei archaeon]|jgi:metal-sulfur cluster biosynthetic enzyme